MQIRFFAIIEKEGSSQTIKRLIDDRFYINSCYIYLCLASISALASLLLSSDFVPPVQSLDYHAVFLCFQSYLLKLEFQIKHWVSTNQTFNPKHTSLIETIDLCNKARGEGGHCKYIRPDQDGTLAIHRTTYYNRSTYYDRTTMNGQSSIVIWSYIFAVQKNKALAGERRLFLYSHLSNKRGVHT